MKIHSRALVKSLALVAATTIRAWMSTLDYQVAYLRPDDRSGRSAYRARRSIFFGTSNILFPIYLRGHCNLAMLLSQHTDAEMLGHVAHHLGFEFVRGSTSAAASAPCASCWPKARR